MKNENRYGDPSKLSRGELLEEVLQLRAIRDEQRELVSELREDLRAARVAERWFQDLAQLRLREGQQLRKQLEAMRKECALLTADV